ncbi:hypothetical protein HHK36_000113 [Tetracentron sinense]|uniref:BZIP domain-containing protein n=1 Tax=Tetracentron sinense TaxID=13715 RepID=A0A835DQI9_TETSI|nr:hypothetical protein HHK36_000113 [Tetracentron sinense]
MWLLAWRPSPSSSPSLQKGIFSLPFMKEGKIECRRSGNRFWFRLGFLLLQILSFVLKIVESRVFLRKSFLFCVSQLKRRIFLDIPQDLSRFSDLKLQALTFSVWILTMGNNEAGTPSTPEKASSPAQEHTNIHPYPDWAAIQAYYGPGGTLPPPYFNSTVTSGHAPHPYMWAPSQPLIPPYGVPYTAIYSHGGVYAHPAVPVVATPLSIETPAKSSSKKGQGLMKKVKGYNGSAVSIGNENAENAAGGSVHGLSQSAECGTEGSNDGSDGNTAGVRIPSYDLCLLSSIFPSTLIYLLVKQKIANPKYGLSSSVRHTKPGGKGFVAVHLQSSLSFDKNGKVNTQASLKPGGEANAASSMALGVTLAPANVAGKLAGPVITPSMTTTMELSGSPNVKRKTAASVPPTAGVVLPPETWVQDERELKRQRRKQSNRESARKSRLRKQTESEEIAMKVESLNVENMALRSEINRITENAEKLRLENALLMVLSLSLSHTHTLSIHPILYEKLNNAQLGQAEEMVSDKNEAEEALRINTENYLSRVNNSDSVDRNVQQESENLENSNSGTKLHQLLQSSPRADAVAAG